MDASPGSKTPPVSPRDWIEPFARLIPFNDAARDKASDAAEVALHSPEQWSRATQNMKIRDNHRTSGSSSSVFTDSDEAGTSNQLPRKTVRYSVEYIFLLANAPAKGAWSGGTGQGTARLQVDFFLSPPTEDKDMAGIHIKFFHHRQTRRLLLQGHHSTIVPHPSDPTMLVKLNRKSVPNTIELARRHTFLIGRYSYFFEYTEAVGTTRYSAALNELMQRTYGDNWEMSSGELSASPDEKPMRLGEYSWPLGAFSKGGSGEVGAGTRANGDPVAVKRLIRPTRRRKDTIRKIMNHIGKHPHIIHLLEIIEDSGANVPAAYIFSEPFCIGTVYDAAKSDMLSLASAKIFFGHYFDAATFLHKEKELMHGDFKPTNLGILSFSPPVGIVLDLDDAIFGLRSTDHSKGTVPYLSPEIAIMKNPQEDWEVVMPDFFGPKSDIWALGLSLYCSLYRLYGHMLINPAAVRLIWNDLEARAKESKEMREICDFIFKTLQIDPENRYSGEEAYAVLAALRLDNSKRQRADEPPAEESLVESKTKVPRF